MDAYDSTDFVKGVPIKISDKFKQPPKITISPSYKHSVNVELITAEYDFKFEGSCLRWMDSYKEKKAKEKSDRNARIAAYESEKQERLLVLKELEEERLNKIKEEEAALQEITDKEPENDGETLDDPSAIIPSTEDTLNDGTNGDLEAETGPLSPNQQVTSFPNHSPVDSTVGATTNNRQFVPTVQFGQPAMRDPTLNGMQGARGSALLIPTQVKPLTVSERLGNSAQKSNINIADFEFVASDPFDTAALNSINDMEELAKVLGTTNVAQHPVNSYTHGTNPVTVPYPNPSYGQNSIPFAAPTPYPFYKPDSNPSHYHTPYTPLTQNAAYPGQDIRHAYRPPFSSVAPSGVGGHYDNKYQLAHSPSAMQYTNSGSSRVERNYGCRVSDQVSNEAPHKRQDLEDFYSKYYSNNQKQPSANGSRSGESTPNNSLSNTLRASASVPDLTIEDQEVFSINKSGASPLSGSRPSSTGIQNVQEYSYGQVFPTMLSQQPRLPDPFLELSVEAQELVQNVSEMGFPRPRVARAVQKLGSDHKKLIEVLLALQNFQENGDSEYTAEVAFYYYMGDLDKVKQFLPTSKQLVNLGFCEEKVVDLLLKTDNDSTKALEQLVA